LIPESVKRIPGYGLLRRALQKRLCPLALNPFLQLVQPGHFYSPIPDLDFVESHKDAIFDRQVTAVPGIEIHAEDQLALLEQFAAFYPEVPFKPEKTAGLRYYFDNGFFMHGDAISLYSVLRHFRPHRVVEVGSGFSSAVMLDTNDLFLSKQVAFTFIEPNPERLLALMSEDDQRQHQVCVSPVQDVPLDVFRSLQAGDIMFVDSSHVAKIGSDVVHILTHVLPSLAVGVLVQFHDVFWPFEYPEAWIREGRAWNEAYILKAFLQFNSTFTILFFNSYLAVHHRSIIDQRFPLWSTYPGASLWLTKTS
jgi:Methyltransferase domain